MNLIKKPSKTIELLNKLNSFLLPILLASIIWEKYAYIELFGYSKGLYTFFVITINFSWLLLNIFIYFKEKIILMKLNNLVLFSVIFTAIFLLNYFTFNEFSIIKLISFIIISTFILEIEKKQLRLAIFRAGLISSSYFFIIYLKEVIISNKDVFDDITGRLEIFGPNAIASGILLTIIFISAREKIFDKLSNKVLLFLNYTFLITCLIQTQSRTFIIAGFLNLVFLLVFKFNLNKELFTSVPSSFLYSFFFNTFKKLTHITKDNLFDNPDTNSLSLTINRIANMTTDGGSGRLNLWLECDKTFISKTIKYIYKDKFSNFVVDCESSHSVFIDILNVQNGLILKLFYFSSIYITYFYFLFKSFYQKNILALNLTTITLFSSFLHNSLRWPINLILFPIIFQLIKDPNIKK